MIPVLSREQMRAFDAHAIEVAGFAEAFPEREHRVR